MARNVIEHTIHKWGVNILSISISIIPSQMEVAPLHCSVDITQKRRLFKNTKENERI